MGRPRKDTVYGFQPELEDFYAERRAEGFIPTELAIICLRNDLKRPGIDKRSGYNSTPRAFPTRIGRPLKSPKPTVARQPAPLKPQPQPAQVEIDDRPPLKPIRLSYLDVMGRRAL